jgi:menaquinone-dependent protoporphyrinogen oxidase
VSPVTHVLVAYGSKHGATAEIADAIAQELRGAGLDADCRPAGEVRGLDGYDALVLGSAVYAKRWRREARRLLARNRSAIAARPLWIFSSGPCGKDPDAAWSEPARVVARAQALGARDHVVFGGRLPLEPANFVERSMIQQTPPEYRDLRDWEQIRAWAGGIARALRAEPSGEPRAA